MLALACLCAILAALYVLTSSTNRGDRFESHDQLIADDAERAANPGPASGIGERPESARLSHSPESASAYCCPVGDLAASLRSMGEVGHATTARRSAARASSRVESSVGNGELVSLMINGISVQPSTTASQPASFLRA